MLPGRVSIFVMRPAQKLYMIGRKQCGLFFFVKHDIAKIEVYCTKEQSDV
jgi:hypothetical protein